MSHDTIRLWLRSWGRRQLYSLLSSLGTLLNHRVVTVMTVIVLGIAMVLPVNLHIIMKNLSKVDLQQQEWGTISVFLRPSVTAEQASEMVARVNARADAKATAISPQQGMEEFRAASGFGSSLDVLESNPLPWVLQVSPMTAGTGNDAELAEQLGQWLQSQEIVDSVIIDYKWMQRLGALLNLGRSFIVVLVLMFSLAVLVVIANTIRLDVASRSDEIEVLSLVGASDGFIRQPFLYTGFWYGLLGAAFAVLLMYACMAYLRRPLSDLLDAYGNSFSLRGLGLTGVLWVLTAGAGLGSLGAWIAVERYLRQLRHGHALRSL